MPINNKNQKKFPKKSEISQTQSAPYLLYIIPDQRDYPYTEAGVGFKRHCPLLVKPTANNLLIQQQWQTATQGHQHI